MPIEWGANSKTRAQSAKPAPNDPRPPNRRKPRCSARTTERRVGARCTKARRFQAVRTLYVSPCRNIVEVRGPRPSQRPWPDLVKKPSKVKEASARIWRPPVSGIRKPMPAPAEAGAGFREYKNYFGSIRALQHRCGRVQAEFTSTRRWALALRPEHHPRSDQSGHVEQPACRTVKPYAVRRNRTRSAAGTFSGHLQRSWRICHQKFVVADSLRRRAELPCSTVYAARSRSRVLLDPGKLEKKGKHRPAPRTRRHSNILS